MNKKLNTDHIKRELEGSAFFPTKQEKVNEQTPEQVDKPNVRTVQPNGVTERSEQVGKLNDFDETTRQVHSGSILDDVRMGKPVDNTRKVKRFSFDIYEDQIPALEELIFRYKRKTGKRLSNSRFIREAIELYLNELKDI